MHRALILATLFACRGGDTSTRAKDPIARAAQIQPGVAKVRRLEFRQPVPAENQSTADFRAFMQKAAAADKTGANQTAALVALGLLPPSVDLAKATEDAYVSQAAAYYDPATKKFYVVANPTDELASDVIAAHELTHGLQDQHFNLEQYLRAAPNSDALTARRFVIEGDATLAMIVWLVYEKTKEWELAKTQLATLRTQFGPYESLDTKAMIDLIKQQTSTSPIQDPMIKKSIDAMHTIPPTIVAPLLAPYFKGVLVAIAAYERRYGWEAINDLYKYPPESTEQVLHPERLFTAIDHPVTITLPTFSNVEVIASDVIGELQWSVYFSLWKHDGPAHPELNWDGDRYAVLRLADGTTGVLIATVWDTIETAKTFEEAYRSTLATRFPDSGEDPPARWVVRSNDRVFIVDNGARDVVDTLMSDTVFAK